MTNTIALARSALPTVVIALLLAGFTWSVVGGVLIDDAYIYLSYMRTLAEHGQWGILPGHESNTATSPLWVLLISAITTVTTDPLNALAIGYIGLTVALALAMHSVSRSFTLHPAFAPVVTAAVTLNPFCQSSVGMESLLGITLIAWSVAFEGMKRPAMSGLLNGLLFLCRPDLAAFSAGFLIVRHGLSRPLLRAAAWYLVPMIVWEIVSWFTLNSLVPDTLLLKQAAATWGPFDYRLGLLMYYGRFPLETVASVILPGLGLLLFVSWLPRDRFRSRTLAALGIGALTHVVAFSLLRVPPYHWYYTITLAVFTILYFALLMDDDHQSRRWIIGASASGVAIAALGAVALVRDGLLNEPREAPISTNWASTRQYIRMAEDLSAIAPGAAVQSPGEIGVLAFHCHCNLIDMFSDRGSFLILVNHRFRESGTLTRAFLFLNYMKIDIDQQPTDPAFALEWRPGAARSDENGAMQSWPATTRWRGDGHFVLKRRDRDRADPTIVTQ